MNEQVREMIDRAVDRFVDGMKEVLDVAGRISLLERDTATSDDAIKYLRQALHEVRAGTSQAPGLHQVHMTNRELTMEVDRLKQNDSTLSTSLKELAGIVGDLKSAAQVQAWKIGAILAVLLFVANRVADAIKFP